jgi:hypothetical protein
MKHFSVILTLSAIIALACNYHNNFANELKLKGNLALISQPSAVELSYFLIVHANKKPLVLLQYPVVELFGNDTLLVVKCIAKPGKANFFQIKHQKGYHPQTPQTISPKAFLHFKNAAVVTFNFTEDVKYNW